MSKKSNAILLIIHESKMSTCTVFVMTVITRFCCWKIEISRIPLRTEQ